MTAEELRNAARFLENPETNAVVAVTDFDFPPQRAFLLEDDALLHGSAPKTRSSVAKICRKQLTIAAVYFARTDAWKSTHSFVMPGCKGFRIDPALRKT